MTGECVVALEGHGTPEERVVVLQADAEVLASAELVREWLDGHGQHVHVDHAQRTVRFGTAGEGLGVVTYELGELPEEDDVCCFGASDRVYVARHVTLRRVK